MTDLWNIVTSDGAELGPMSPLEIRDAMREGRIDPFDQVCRAGSKVMRDLVEVDEIFAAAEGVSKKKSDSIYDEPEEEASEPNKKHQSTVISKSTPKAKPKTSSATKIVSPKKPDVEKPRAPISKRDKKRFHVTNKRGQSLGPLSPAEIQSLFYRGVLTKNVKVQKDNTAKKIPIQQFISAYVGAKAKHFKSEHTKLGLRAGGNKWRYPNSQVMEQLKRTAIHNIRSGKNSNYLIAIAIVATVVLGYFALDQLFPKKPLASSSIKSQAVVIDIQKKIAPPKNVGKKTEAKKLKHGKPKTKKAKASAKPRKRKVLTKKTRNRSRRKTRNMTYSAPVRKPVPPYYQKRKKLAARRAPPNPYEARVGGIVTISKAKYSLATLVKCQLKCELPFIDSGRRRITGVFFKAQYEKALRQKKGTAIITGRLEKKSGKYRIYLQGVR